MKKRYLIGLVLCCLMIIPLVGCSKKDETETAKVKTPIQLLTDRVNASDIKNALQDQTDFDLSTRITNEIAAVSHYNDAPIIARIVALEALNWSNISSITEDIAWHNSRLSSLENYNVSPRLTTLESLVGTFNITIYPNVSNRLLALETLNWSTALINISVLQNGNIALGNRITALETFNNSTNISARLANLESRINASPLCKTIPDKPILTFPNNSATDIPVNTSLWWDSTLNASHYEVWVTGLSPMPVVTDVSGYTLLNLTSNTTYTWRVIAINNCGGNTSLSYNFTTKNISP
jgi:hypothetical protein